MAESITQTVFEDYAIIIMLSFPVILIAAFMLIFCGQMIVTIVKAVNKQKTKTKHNTERTFASEKIEEYRPNHSLAWAFPLIAIMALLICRTGQFNLPSQIEWQLFFVSIANFIFDTVKTVVRVRFKDYRQNLEIAFGIILSVILLIVVLQ